MNNSKKYFKTQTTQGKMTYLEVSLGAGAGQHCVVTHRGEWREHRDDLHVLQKMAVSCPMIEFLEAKYEFLEEELSATEELINEIEGLAAIDSDLCAARNVMQPLEYKYRADGQPLSF